MISATHPMAAKCTEDVHFRLHMYANCSWLNCTTQNHKPCADDIHVQSKMNILDTFGNRAMGGGDTPAYYISGYTGTSKVLLFLHVLHGGLLPCTLCSFVRL